MGANGSVSMLPRRARSALPSFSFAGFAIFAREIFTEPDQGTPAESLHRCRNRHAMNVQAFFVPFVSFVARPASH
ncbi:hypothetical protein B1C78_08310 [Thioalkalivibrio denitrificans]|uniref:Uncharacterized protein n=1 Tax=Thioalkalivibrio denitrificans TaxID=108003 RepID=A0A1V3NIK6_9GAMM|nr:hypothetical protein B1C78_08310 [Thioalkalivibrio denitrificans]